MAWYSKKEGASEDAAGRVSHWNSRASRGLMVAVISLLWVEMSALIELVKEY
jgi:hypothetical protein